MTLPRYPAYRESGVAWLGQVPAHWRTVRLQDVAAVINGFPFDSALFDESVGYPLIRIRDLNSAETATRYRGAYQQTAEVTSGDILIGMDGEFNVGRWLGSEPALLNQRMCCVRTDSSALSTFIRNALPIPLKAINDVTYSTTVKHLSSLDVLKIRLALPEAGELASIATFLDRETAKIDELIAEQEKLIALLAEKRQATISHAVTRGLNPNAPMKDSGVPWLGEVPAHWAVKPLGRIAIDRCDGPFGSGIKSDHYRDSGAMVIRLQNIRAGAFNLGEPVYLDEVYFRNELQGHEVLASDLLIAGLGDDNNLLGRACVAPSDLGAALVKADCFRFRLDTSQALPTFAAWQLSAGAAFDAGVLATGTTRSRIPLGVMATRKVALPPVAEQAQITDFVAEENARIDLLTADASRGIELLKERRSALIAAAVTGQIDVRGAVAA